MNDAQNEQWCPRCREAAGQLETPLPAPIATLDDHFALAADPAVRRRKYRCEQCQTQWDSFELPASFVEELRVARKCLVDAQRRVAMLRLLLASERRQHALSAEAVGEAPIARAA